MSELIWCWRKGNKTIYTKCIDVVEQAMEEGNIVKVLKNGSHIFRN